MSSTPLLLYPSSPTLSSSSSSSSPSRPHFLSPLKSPTLRLPTISCSTEPKNAKIHSGLKNQKWVTALLGAGVALAVVGPAVAGEFHEPPNALSLPTWAVHVSSVVEWITAMVLVWQYGEKSGNETWKGLSWGMVPALGGAMCACTWHFFYNAESLEVLVALQAALTVLGNCSMCIAAFRIYKSQSRSENL